MEFLPDKRGLKGKELNIETVQVPCLDVGNEVGYVMYGRLHKIGTFV